MVLLGGSPAALIGVLTILIGWPRWREPADMLLNNLLTYATFPLAGGLLFLGVTEAAGIATASMAYYMLVFALFLIALTINFAMVWSYSCYVKRLPFMLGVRSTFLVLLPSELESFGLSALEAMACGVPVVGSDAGGLPEVVKHAETGYLLPVGDVEGMAARTLEILKDEERRRELGHAGRRRAEALFGAERVVSQYERFYEKVLGG